MESIWYNKIKLQLEEKVETLYKKDFKFYKVDYLLSLAKKVDQLSTNCPDCKVLKQKIESTVNEIDTLLSGSITLRKEYERRLDEIDKHVRKTHNIYPKQYFLYINTFIGILFGLGLGVLIALAIDSSYIKTGLIFGFTIGLIAGRILGKLKEKKFEQEGKLL